MFFKKIVNELEPELVELDKIIMTGVRKNTSAKDILRDVTFLSKEYSKQRENLNNLKEPREFITMSYEYSLSGKNYAYFLGDVAKEEGSNLPAGFINEEIPEGRYLKINVKAKNKFHIGRESNKLKEEFYREWIHKSKYKLHDDFLEFEFHDEKSIGKNPEVNVYVRIK